MSAKFGPEGATTSMKEDIRVMGWSDLATIRPSKAQFHCGSMHDLASLR